MRYNFYFDETFHDPKITIKEDGILNVLKENTNESYIGVFWGYEYCKEKSTYNRIKKLEDKYAKIFEVKDELKSTTIGKKYFVYGIRSFNKNAYDFYDDLFTVLEDVKPMIHINMVSKVELLVRNIFDGNELCKRIPGIILNSFYYGLGSINTKFDDEGNLIQLVPRTSKKEFNYNGQWDIRPDGKKLKKFDIVLTNPPFGEARSWEPTGNEKAIAECYEVWNRYKQNKIDLGVIFLENAVRILDENGRMAIVLSNSIASVDAHSEARKWLCENLRIVAIIDLPANIFAEAGVNPSIIIGYKPKKEELMSLQKNNYQVFSKDIKKVGYEVKTKNKVKFFETRYKINPITFEKEITPTGEVLLDEEFTSTVEEFKEWCNMQEDTLKRLFL